MVKTFVRMAEFGLVVIVFMMAMLGVELFFQMDHSIKRLEKYCSQYYQSHHWVYYGKPFLHQVQR